MGDYIQLLKNNRISNKNKSIIIIRVTIGDSHNLPVKPTAQLH
jgi:hypothetical protein